MTRTGIINAINTQLTAIITQAKVRLASLALVDELYTTVTEQSNEVAGTIYDNDINLFYRMRVSKSGNTVCVNGFVQNTTGAMVSSQNLFSIVNSEYLPIPNIDAFCLDRITTSKPNCLLIILGNKIRIGEEPLNNNETIFFNFTYKTVL
jgi:hypothetical protein